MADLGSTKVFGDLDVTGEINGEVAGNAATATKLATARTIGLSGDVSGSASFDGSGNASITATVNNIDGNTFVNSDSGNPVNADTIASNGVSYYNGGVTNFSGNATDGALYSQQYSSIWQHQIAGDYRSGQIAVRGKNNGTWTSWNKVWTQGNDGSGSGLDADLLDGQHGSYYLNTSTTFGGDVSGTYNAIVVANDSHSHSNYVLKAGDTMTGDLTFGSGDNIHRSTHSSGYIVGSYNSVGANSEKSNPIYTIGSSYQPSDTSLGNMYGIGYSHGNASFGGINSMLSGWGLYVASDGDARIGLDASEGIIRSTGVAYVNTNQRVFADNYHPNADKWTTARTLTLTGDVTGSVSWDGSGNASLSTVVGDDSHCHSQVFIPDTRGAVRAPSYYPDRYVSYDFQNQADTGAGDDSWHVLQTVAKWSTFNSTHSQQQIAYTGPNLKHREATSDTAWGAWKTVWDSGNDGSGSGLDADKLDGLELHTGVNNVANRVVRTDGSGYIQAGWINSISGATTSTITRITASNDAYLRYVTPATFRSQIITPYYATLKATASAYGGSKMSLSGTTLTITTT